tara:strand:+ start:7503 stop:8789 length:1287 start_codon:yes stop_codon:yes gene_type:complete
MSKTEKFGYTNQNFIQSNYCKFKFDYESYNIEGLSRVVRSQTNVNSIDKTNTFIGKVFKILPTETAPIPGGLLDAIKNAGILNYENLQQCYVRVPEAHSLLPLPEDEDDSVIEEYSLCVAPISEDICVGTAVVVQFNNTEAFTYGIVVSTSAQNAIDVTEDYVPGEAPKFPAGKNNNLARITSVKAMYKALGLAQNARGQSAFREYNTRNWETWNKKRPHFKALYGKKGIPQVAIKAIEAAAKMYEIPVCILHGIMKAESGGGRPVGIFGQSLFNDNPTIAAANKANSSAFGVGQVVASTFLGTAANFSLRCAHWEIGDPIQYGYKSVAHVIVGHVISAGSLTGGLRGYAGTPAGGIRKKNGVSGKCGGAAGFKKVDKVISSKKVRRKYYENIIDGAIALKGKPDKRFINAAVKAGVPSEKINKVRNL